MIRRRLLVSVALAAVLLGSGCGSSRQVVSVNLHLTAVPRGRIIPITFPKYRGLLVLHRSEPRACVYLRAALGHIPYLSSIRYEITEKCDGL